MKHEYKPVLTRIGRMIRIEFEAPFLPGDKTWDANTLKLEEVDQGMEYAIRVRNECVELTGDGSWYLKCHSQKWGRKQFLPTKSDLADFFIADMGTYMSRWASITTFFADEPELLDRLTKGRNDYIDAEISKHKADLAQRAETAAERIRILEGNRI